MPVCTQHAFIQCGGMHLLLTLSAYKIRKKVFDKMKIPGEVLLPETIFIVKAVNIGFPKRNKIVAGLNIML